MASPSAAAGQSRLSLVQMKFKQKQLQEREQRRLELTMETAANHRAEANVPPTNVAQGKVRQMFDERRRGVGIDRSQPLKPITSVSSKPSTINSKPSQMNVRNGGTAPTTLTNGAGGSTTGQKFKRPGNFERTTSVILPNQRTTNSMTKTFSTLSLADRKAAAAPVKPQDRNNNTSRNNISSITNTSKSLKPVLAKKSPPTFQPAPPAKSHTTATPAGRSTAGTASGTSAVINTPATQRKTAAPASGQLPPAQNSARQTSNKMSNRTAAAPPPEDLNTIECRICHRHFNSERIRKHEQVCQKVTNTKRKIFDAAKHRIKGTDAEKFLKKPSRSQMSRKSYSSAAAVTGIKPAANSGFRKNNWRQKHEEFIAAIRAAKQVQVHLARGGKLSDLPPPPPSENPDYIQCPHCLRRFNEAAAERHIPRCAEMQHNKPKPKPPQSRNRK